MAKRVSQKEEMKALEEKQREAAVLIDQFYKEFDKDGDNALVGDEVKELLKRVCAMSGKYTPSETALDAAIQKVPPGGIRKADMPVEFVKLRGFLDQQVYIDKTFQEFDPDRTGYIDRKELAVLMARMAGGKVPAEADVDFVLKKCDIGPHQYRKGTPKPKHKITDGHIDRNEILPVICIWKAILIERVKGNDPIANEKTKKHSTSCAIS